MEIEMERFRLRAATRYITYRAKQPGQHLNLVAVLELFVNAMNIPGTSSNLRGKGNEKLPEKVRVTVEWDDAPDDMLMQ